MEERGKVIRILVRRVAGWNEEYPVQPELARRRARRLQVAGMNRIEGSTEKRDVHAVESPTSQQWVLCFESRWAAAIVAASPSTAA